jgi:hypothetical protein
MKIALFSPSRLSGDTICTRGNPINRGNYLPEITETAGSNGAPPFSTILVHPLKKKEYNFLNLIR